MIEYSDCRPRRNSSPTGSIAIPLATPTSLLRADLETLSVPMPASRRRTAAETPFPREGGLRRDRRQVPRREECRTDGLVGAVVVALVRIGAAELCRIDMAMRQQLLLAIPSDTARRQRRRDCSVADGVAWWGCASRPPVRAETNRGSAIICAKSNA
jgi:hypothetical protein